LQSIKGLKLVLNKRNYYYYYLAVAAAVSKPNGVKCQGVIIIIIIIITLAKYSTGRFLQLNLNYIQNQI